MNKRKIKALRNRFGLTQTEFAKALGVSSTTVSRWEQGQKPSAGSSARLNALSGQPWLSKPVPLPVPGMSDGEVRQRLAAALSEAVDSVPDIQYALGGADAMAVHGYVRETRDIDVFVLEEFLNKFAAALTAAGLKFFPINEGSGHWAAKLPNDTDPERRIDVLVPYGEPELSGVEYATTGVRFGRTWRVLPADLMVAGKFYAYTDTGDPKYLNDMLALYRRGVFDPCQVREIIVFLEEGVKEWDSVIKSFKVRKRPGRGRTVRTRRIPRS